MSAAGITRREMVRQGGLLALPAFFRGPVAAAETTSPARPSPQPPARGSGRPGHLPVDRGAPVRQRPRTYTILSGSTMLPEVRAAMDAASRHYVHLDELTDASAPVWLS